VPHPSFAFSAKEGGDFDFPSAAQYKAPADPESVEAKPHKWLL